MTWREFIDDISLYERVKLGLAIGTFLTIVTVSLLFFRETSVEAARRIEAEQELKTWITDQIVRLKEDTGVLRQNVQKNAETAAALKKEVAAEKARPKNVNVTFPELKPSPTAGISADLAPRPRAEKKEGIK